MSYIVSVMSGDIGSMGIGPNIGIGLYFKPCF